MTNTPKTNARTLSQGRIPMVIKLSMGFLVLFVLFALFGSYLTSYGYRETALTHQLEAPAGGTGWRHRLEAPTEGTDWRHRACLAAAQNTCWALTRAGAT